MLTLHLLGTTLARLDDTPLSLKRRKSRALLYYLAAQPQPVARRRLTTLLWGDHNEQTARHNLRTTLYGLRQAIGDHLRAEDETVSLVEVQVDARDFATTLTHPGSDLVALTAALVLYQGDFLADFELGDSDDFDDWVAVEREHYRRLAIRGYQQVSRGREAAGDFAAALDALTAALTLDPFQEDLQRDALRLHTYAGDRAGAIRRYEELTRLLDDEMGVPPMAETRAIYDAIITDSLPPAPRPAAPVMVSPTAPPRPPAPVAAPPPAPQRTTAPVPPRGRQDGGVPGGPPFAGRAAELHRLRDGIGRGQLILVEGEAGMGKSRLVETFLAAVQAADAPPPLVLVGRARELESRLPYQPMIEALRGLVADAAWSTRRGALQLPAVWWAEVARLLPEVADPALAAAGLRAPDESRLWEGVFQLLAALAATQPIFCFVDDLHWADAATLGLLGYLVRQSAAQQLPITFLAASRSTPPRSEVGSLTQALSREDRLLRLPLTRLEAEAVMELARSLSPTYGYPLGNWLYRSSEGIPLVLAELVRYARSEQLLLPDGAVNLNRLPTTPVVPPTIYALTQARLAPLTDAARRVLDAAVATGREFDFEVVARAAALSDLAALDALDELRAARLVVALDQQRFAFDHSLTMEVAYQEVGELRHRLLHRRVAAALESIHDDSLDEVAGLIAEHYAEGGQPDLAAKYARRAGQRAARLAAWKSAIAFFKQALDATPRAEQAALRVALGSAQIHAGELAAAADTLRGALEMREIDLDTLRAALQGLGESLILQARYADVIALAQRFAGHPHAGMRIVTEFMWGAALSLEGLDLAEAASHLAQAEVELQANPDTGMGALAAQVEFELGNIDAQQDRLPAALTHYRRTLELAQAADHDDAIRSQILAHNNLAYHLHLLNDPAAMTHIQAGLALARDKGMVMLLPYLLSTAGEIALAQDDVAAAEVAFSQALAHAQRLAQPERIAGLTANLGLVAQRRGQTELAVHRFSTALAQADVIHARFLAAQIRLWLVPLLPAEAAAAQLAEARAIITSGQYRRLLPQLAALDAA